MTKNAAPVPEQAPAAGVTDGMTTAAVRAFVEYFDGGPLEWLDPDDRWHAIRAAIEAALVTDALERRSAGRSR